MPTATPATGILSVWNDIAPEIEDFYERWYMREHFPERLAVPGFRRGRRYEAIEADHQFFTFYDLDTPEVLFSKPYLERLESPTEWTRKVMPHWRGMLRTACERLARRGDAIGAYVAVARWEAPVTLQAAMADALRAAIDDPAVVAIDLWRASARQNAPTRESRERPAPDQTIAGALLIESTRVASAERMAVAIPKLLPKLPAPANVGVYGLIALQDA
jgi:hypothetical protein